MKLRIAIVIALVSFFVSPALADKRIKFARGKSSATVSGVVSTGGRVCYFADARTGQVLTASVRSRSGHVQIFESGETTYRLDVETSGDQSVCVDNIRGRTSYSLTVSIR